MLSIRLPPVDAAEEVSLFLGNQLQHSVRYREVSARRVFIIACALTAGAPTLLATGDRPTCQVVHRILHVRQLQCHRMYGKERQRFMAELLPRLHKIVHRCLHCHTHVAVEHGDLPTALTSHAEEVTSTAIWLPTHEPIQLLLRADAPPLFLSRSRQGRTRTVLRNMN